MSKTLEQLQPNNPDTEIDDDFDFDEFDEWQEGESREINLEDSIGAEYFSEISFENSVTVKILEVDGNKVKIAIKNEAKNLISGSVVEENIFYVLKDDLTKILRDNSSLSGTGFNKIASLISGLSQKDGSAFVKKMEEGETNF